MKKILFLTLFLLWSCGDDKNTSPTDDDKNILFNIEVDQYNSSNSELLSDAINNVKLAYNGELLIGTDKGINIVDQNYNWKSLSREKGTLSLVKVKSLDLDRNGNYWYTDGYEGLCNTNLKLDTFYYYPKLGLDEMYPKDILIDNDSKVYLATNENGVIKINNNDRWIDTSKIDIVSRKTNSQFPWNRLKGFVYNRKTDEIWIAAQEIGLGSNKIVRVKNDKFTEVYGATTGINFDFTNTMFVDNNGILWISTYEGIAIYDGNYWEVIKKIEKANGNYIQASLKDKNDNIWSYVKDQGFIIFLDKEQKWIDLNELTNKMPSFQFKGLLLDYNNDIIIVTQNSGIFRVKV